MKVLSKLKVLLIAVITLLSINSCTEELDVLETESSSEKIKLKKTIY